MIYEFTCPGCNESYIGKTERNLHTRLKEHLDPAKSAISKHLTDCDNADYLINFNNLYDNVFDSDSHTGDSPHYSFTNIIQNNTRILHSLKFSNSNLLLFLEALHIKFKKPELNSGLKASKELVVFPQSITLVNIYLVTLFISQLFTSSSCFRVYIRSEYASK